MPVDALTVAAVRRGDAAAFEVIVREFQPRLYRFLYGLLGDAELARDLTQDTFLAAFRALPATQPDLNLTGWLFQIARNCARSHWRRRRLPAWVPFVGGDRSPDDEGPPVTGPEGMVIERQVLAAALCRLQRTDRECLLLCADGFSYGEIVEITGFSLPKVKTDLHRARTELRRRIRPYLGVQA